MTKTMTSRITSTLIWPHASAPSAPWRTHQLPRTCAAASRPDPSSDRRGRALRQWLRRSCSAACRPGSRARTAPIRWRTAHSPAAQSPSGRQSGQHSLGKADFCSDYSNSVRHGKWQEVCGKWEGDSSTVSLQGPTGSAQCMWQVTMP